MIVQVETGPVELVIWQCDQCGRPIRSPGYLSLDVRGVIRYSEDLKRWQADNEGVDIPSLATRPRRAQWRVHHQECADEMLGDWSIAVDSASKLCDVIAWTTVIEGKGWMETTNWSSILLKIARTAGSTAANTCEGS